MRHATFCRLTKKNVWAKVSYMDSRYSRTDLVRYYAKTGIIKTQNGEKLESERITDIARIFYIDGFLKKKTLNKKKQT